MVCCIQEKFVPTEICYVNSWVDDTLYFMLQAYTATLTNSSLHNCPE